MRKVGVMAVAVGMMLMVAAPAHAAGAMAPQNARVMGHSYRSWAQVWGQWAFADGSNPLIASLEEGDCGDVVRGVYLMAAPIAEGVELECHVPLGTPIVLTHAGTFGWIPVDAPDDASLEEIVAGWFNVVSSDLRLDGRSLPLFTTHSGAFDAQVEQGSFLSSLFGVEPGTLRMAVVGQFAVILPLSPGAHHVDASVRFADGAAYSATYHLHVG